MAARDSNPKILGALFVRRARHLKPALQKLTDSRCSARHPVLKPPVIKGLDLFCGQHYLEAFAAKKITHHSTLWRGLGEKARLRHCCKSTIMCNLHLMLLLSWEPIATASRLRRANFGAIVATRNLATEAQLPGSPVYCRYECAPSCHEASLLLPHRAKWPLGP